MRTERKNPRDPLKAALDECKQGSLYLIGFGFVINLLFLVTPLYMIQVFDRVLSSQRMETLLYLTLIAGFALMIMGALETVRGRIQTRMGNWLEKSLAGDLLRASIDAALQGFNANAQALRDLGTIRMFISSGLKALLDVPWAPIFVAALWLLHPTLGWFAAGSALLLLLLAVVNELAARRPAQEANSARIANETIADQAIRNADVIRAMGMFPEFRARWLENNLRTLDRHRVASDRNSLLFGITRFARMTAQVGILGLGAYFVILSELTAGGMIAGSILLGRALAPMEQVMGAWRGMIAARAARRRLTLLMEGLPEEAAPMQLPNPRGVLTCDNVWFTPRQGDEPIIAGVSFSVDPGQVLAIMGPSASGKSTLCKLVVGSWVPNKGYIRLDAAEISNWAPEALGPHIGYLPQEFELFSATVKENIGRLSIDADPSAVIAAAKAAGVHETILALPDGYNTQSGRGGMFLSGGQRQRLGLARALYGRPRLIVLDEPDANLDTEGEEALVAAIDKAKDWGAAIILVTHNSRVLRPVDNILVLRDGEKLMLGTRSGVLQALTPKTMRLVPLQSEFPEITATSGKTNNRRSTGK
jgi:PrtD family type I secretion system ABC transporter